MSLPVMPYGTSNTYQTPMARSSSFPSAIGNFTQREREIMQKKAIRFAARKNDSLKNPDEAPLTSADIEGWWEYLRVFLPKNYKLANFLKAGGYDPNLRMNCDKNLFNYNDYFDIYGLPRVKTLNHEIVVNNTIKLKITDNESYVKAKNIFAAAHHDDRFHEWKIYQYAYSQNGKCAWCENPVEYDKTEVDHVQPLAFHGKNVSWNLVVACKDCNGEKFTDTTGWNDDADKTKKNKKKSWIKENKKDVLWRDILEKARKEVASMGGKYRYAAQADRINRNHLKRGFLNVKNGEIASGGTGVE